MSANAPHWRIATAIGKRKGFRFVGLVETFRDHPACDHDTRQWINGVVEGERDESFHPNEAGHQAIANRLRQFAKRWFK